ncbi:MAG: dihydroorotase [Gammaproteobacteria bacterium]|nr:dihydroorotase [Gammaproteobacteria bacterium]
MSSIRINNGRIIDPANNLDKEGTVCIENGRIVSCPDPIKGFKPELVIDAKGYWVCPGIVDLSLRLSKNGEEPRTTVSNEAEAISASGVTSACCPPDIMPVIDTPAVVESLLQTAEHSHRIRIFPIGALTHGLKGDRLSEMYTLKEAGCIAVSNGLSPVANNEILRRAFEYAASTDMLVMIHPEDPHLSNRGVVNEGAISTRLGLPPIPSSAETVAVSTALLLIEQTGVRAHFCRLSTARAVDMIAAAKRDGLPVSADVDITHLFMTEMDVDDFNSNSHMRPPLRSMEDRAALERGVIDGIIDAVCSDHQILGSDAKSAPFSLTRPGGATVECLIPLILDLINRGKISAHQGIATLSQNPARILDLPFGTLSIEAPADLIIVDPNLSWSAGPNTLLSTGKCTPFSGWEMQGKVVHTLLAGEIVYPLPNK